MVKHNIDCQYALRHSKVVNSRVVVCLRRRHEANNRTINGPLEAKVPGPVKRLVGFLSIHFSPLP
jgi:hypothetical protein